MMTVREAMQRVAQNNARIKRVLFTNEWVVTLNEWREGVKHPATYYTDDLEDAVLTAGAMRRQATSH